MTAIQEVSNISKIRRDIIESLLAELHGSTSSNDIVDNPWESNIGPLVDLCAACTTFNKTHSLSESERHRYIRVLSKSLQVMNLAARKEDTATIQNLVRSLIIETAELYADIEINKKVK